MSITALELLKERLILNDKTKTPTELVPLPSRGLVYPKNHPFHLLEYVPIKSLTVSDEDILLNVAFNKLNIVVSELLKSCIPLKGMDSYHDLGDHLLAADVAALLYAIRMNSYGPILDPVFTCPSCNKRFKEFNIDLREVPINIMDFSPIAIGENRFLYKNKKTTIEFKLLTYNQHQYLQNIIRSANQADEELFANSYSSSTSTYVTSFLLTSIISHNGNINDGSFRFSSMIRKMPLKESMRFRNYVSENGPSVLGRKEIICNHYSGDYIEIDPATGEERISKDIISAACDFESSLDLPWDHEIFSIRPENKKEIILEPAFIMSYYAGFSWTEFMNYPVAYKKHYIERMNEEINKAQKAQADISTKAPHHNNQEIRQLTGKVKSITPNSKMQRFT